MVERIRSLLLGAAAVLAVAIPVFAPMAAHAADEVFTWVNKDVIKVTGGRVSGTGELRRNPPDNNAGWTFSGLVRWVDNTNCRIRINLTPTGSGDVQSKANVTLALDGYQDNCRDFGTITYRDITLNATSAGTNPGTGVNPDTGPALSGGTSSTGSSEEDVTCDAGPTFTWLLCGIIESILGGIDWIRTEVIIPFLKEQPIDPTGSDEYSRTLLAVWGAFRNLANVFFILIFFLTIFGTAIGFDNYTVKKILPRLIAAAILVQLSFVISAVIVDIGNVLGQGIVSLLDNLIPAPKIDFTTGWSDLFLGGALLGVGAAAIGAAMGLSLAAIVSMGLALLVVFFTLVFRRILIVLIVVISPLLALLWVPPNTEKKAWEGLETLVKLSLMYVLIMLLFELGRLFAKAAELAGGAGSYGSAAITPLVIMAGYVVPLILVPFTFLWAGRGMKAGANGIKSLANRGEKKFGNSSDWAKDRRETRKQRSALVATDPSANAFRRAVARKRGGFGGAVIGSGTGRITGKIPGLRMSTGNRMRMNAAKTKALKDQGASNAEEIAGGGTSRKDAVNQQTQAALADLHNKRKNEYGNMFKSANGGAGLDPGHLKTLASGGTIDGKTVGLGNQTLGGDAVQERAIEDLAKLGEYGHLRNEWKTGRISTQRLQAGLGGVSDAASKARDMIMATSTTNAGDDAARRSSLKDRNVDQFSNFDKSTRWEYMQGAAASGDQSRVDEVYRNMAGALEKGGSSLDIPTLEAARNGGMLNTKDANGNAVQTDLGFSAEQKATIQTYFNTDGTVKGRAKEVVMAGGGQAPPGPPPSGSGTPLVSPSPPSPAPPAAAYGGVPQTHFQPNASGLYTPGNGNLNLVDPAVEGAQDDTGDGRGVR